MQFQPHFKGATFNERWRNGGADRDIDAVAPIHPPCQQNRKGDAKSERANMPNYVFSPGPVFSFGTQQEKKTEKNWGSM